MIVGYGSSGLPVEHLQRALGCHVDGDFGRQTQAVLRGWQKSRSLPETGECSEIEWRDLTGRPVPTLFDRCLAVTSSIEGHGWGKARVLKDGAGITAGLIGFTTKFRSLNRVFEIAGADRTMLALRPDGKLSPGQADSINRALATDAGKAAQVQVAHEIYWQKARNMAQRNRFEEYPWYVGLCFDIAVQNGGIAGSFSDIQDVDSRAQAMVAAVVKRVAEADQRREAKFADDVSERKCLFLHGAGTVHGRFYKLTAYGLEHHAPELMKIPA